MLNEVLTGWVKGWLDNRGLDWVNDCDDLKAGLNGWLGDWVDLPEGGLNGWLDDWADLVNG